MNAIRTSFYSAVIAISAFSLQAQNGLDFDPSGTADYVQTTFAGVTGVADRTFEAWIYLSGTPSGNTAISDYGLNAVGSRNTFYVNSSLRLGFISGGTNANISSTSNAVPTNRWTHVAFVLKSGTGYLYVDGVQVGTGSLGTVNTPSGNGNLRIGQRVNGGNIPFDGIIDEYRMWNVARTASQLMADRNAEYCGIPTGLVAYYKFNEGQAGGSNTAITTAVDEVAGANGSLLNFALSGNSSNWVTGASLAPGLAVNNLTFNECAGFSFTVGTTVYDSTGMYSDTLVGAALYGCDSVVNLNLTVTQAIDTSVSNSSPSLTANQAGASYQWLDCNANYNPISGATGQSFTAAISGQFAVEITINNCVDTSACQNLLISGFNLDESRIVKASLYPNPTNSTLNIEMAEDLEDADYMILNASGLIMFQGSMKFGRSFSIDVSDLKPGLYTFKIKGQGFPFVKE